jgi:acyl-coenzyme A thioesterase PaaI-like protein
MFSFIQSILIRFYPLFILNGICLGMWRNQYRNLRVYIIKHPINFNGAFTVFGGSIASAADPFLPLMFYLALKEKGITATVLTKSVSVKFIKPVKSIAYFDFVISEEELAEAKKHLIISGKYIATHNVYCTNSKGDAFAYATIQSYMKVKSFA